LNTQGGTVALIIFVQAVNDQSPFEKELWLNFSLHGYLVDSEENCTVPALQHHCKSFNIRFFEQGFAATDPSTKLCQLCVAAFAVRADRWGLRAANYTASHCDS